jgi:hypothetical protein
VWETSRLTCLLWLVSQIYILCGKIFEIIELHLFWDGGSTHWWFSFVPVIYGPKDSIVFWSHLFDTIGYKNRMLLSVRSSVGIQTHTHIFMCYTTPVESYSTPRQPGYPTGCQPGQPANPTLVPRPLTAARARPANHPTPNPPEPRNTTGQTRFICTHQIPFSPGILHIYHYNGCTLHEYHSYNASYRCNSL